MLRIATTALMLSAVAAPTQAQSVYEVQIGMHSRAVDQLLGAEVFKKKTDQSSESDEEWEGIKFNIYFCKGYVSVIRIKLSDGVASFSRAVDTERKVRGEPRWRLESRLWGSVAAEWSAPGAGQFHISMTQHGDAEVTVDRWTSARRGCAK